MGGCSKCGMWRSIQVREFGLGARTLPRVYIGAIRKRFSPSIWADPEVVPYAARVSIWGRWILWLVSVFHLAYRPADWYPGDIEHVFLHVPLVTLNGLVHFRLLTNRPVTWRWLAVLSAMDIVLITADIVIGGGFKSFTFLAYYPALAVFAAVFTVLWLSLAWTTMAAVAYVVVSVGVGSGLDLGGGGSSGGDLRVLVGRLAAMYALVLCVSLITRFERTKRQAALERERQMQRERIELSQEIHDTTAQTAYMIGMGDPQGQGAGGRVERGVDGRSGRDRRAVEVGHVGAEAPHRCGSHLRGQGAGTRPVVALCDV